MSKKTVEINGRIFELQKQVLNKPTNWYIHNYSNLDECYTNASVYKKDIFNEWYQWYRKTTEKPSYSDFGIASYNCMYFSLQGYIWYGSEPYYFYITYAHNRIWRIEA